MVTKGDIVNMGLRKATIASVSMAFQPEPEAVQEALEDLEALVASWVKDGVDIGYLIDPTGQPNPSDDSGIELAYKLAVAQQLARHILIDNNRDVPMELARQANISYDMLKTSFYKPVPLKQRNDMPTGGGNKPYFAADRFYFDGTDK